MFSVSCFSGLIIGAPKLTLAFINVTVNININLPLMYEVNFQFQTKPFTNSATYIYLFSKPLARLNKLMISLFFHKTNATSTSSLHHNNRKPIIQTRVANMQCFLFTLYFDMDEHNMNTPLRLLLRLYSDKICPSKSRAASSKPERVYNNPRRCQQP